MEYKGKLYGKLGEIYFETGKTSEDWDELEKECEKSRSLQQVIESLARKVAEHTGSCPLDTLGNTDIDCEKICGDNGHQVEDIYKCWIQHYINEEGKLNQ